MQFQKKTESFEKKLNTHLEPLQRRELIDLWLDLGISAGVEMGDRCIILFDIQNIPAIKLCEHISTKR